MHATNVTSKGWRIRALELLVPTVLWLQVFTLNDCGRAVLSVCVLNVEAWRLAWRAQRGLHIHSAILAGACTRATHTCIPPSSNTVIAPFRIPLTNLPKRRAYGVRSGYLLEFVQCLLTSLVDMVSSFRDPRVSYLSWMFSVCIYPCKFLQPARKEPNYHSINGVSMTRRTLTEWGTPTAPVEQGQ
ncbi:hypothetical protein EDB85DRAFT_862472 [Lactarius pseudohatsudake]|nr:hypothetical protein EDB85DRAFT_862472 [Lactarius pseudohatsudake]